MTFNMKTDKKKKKELKNLAFLQRKTALGW